MGTSDSDKHGDFRDITGFLPGSLGLRSHSPGPLGVLRGKRCLCRALGVQTLCLRQPGPEVPPLRPACWVTRVGY